jgi:undecaprenyl-diphosphatase
MASDAGARRAAVLEAIGRFDAAADDALAPLRGNPTVDRIMYAASELGDFSLIWHFAAAVQALTSEEHADRLARLSLLIAAESLVVNQGIKRVFRRARPVLVEERPRRLRTPLTTSFPSGHASAAFTAAALLSKDDRLAPLWYGAATVVATSRLHVRIHHASDVLGGVLVGLAFGWIGRRVVFGSG